MPFLADSPDTFRRCAYESFASRTRLSLLQLECCANEHPLRECTLYFDCFNVWTTVCISGRCCSTFAQPLLISVSFAEMPLRYGEMSWGMRVMLPYQVRRKPCQMNQASLLSQWRSFHTDCMSSFMPGLCRGNLGRNSLSELANKVWRKKKSYEKRVFAKLKVFVRKESLRCSPLPRRAL